MSLQALVGYLLTEVLAHHHRWPYKHLSERWQIAAAGLQVLAAALEYSEDLAKGARWALSQQGAGPNLACMLCPS